jgi:hypothetical protein
MIETAKNTRISAVVKRITKSDARARALQLNPRKRQNNAFSRYFVITPPITLGERMDYERMERCCKKY